MRMQLSTCVLSLLAAWTLAATPAHAASTRAAITDIGYQLIDLDLTDNVTPSFTIDYTSIYNDSLYTIDDNHYEFERLSQFGSVSVSGARGSAAAGSSATAIFSNANYVTPVGAENASSGASHQLGFTLSPNTGLLVTALGSLSSDPVTAIAQASLYVSGTMDNRVDGVRSSQNFANSFHLATGASEHKFRGYLATGSAAERGYLYFSSSTSVTAPPVPEPATYGMLLAGVLVIGVAARGKARRA